MSFSLSDTTITQSGTDTNLSGLNGINGVVERIYGTTPNEFRVYELSSRKLTINGTLTLDMSKTDIVFIGASEQGLLKIGDTGNLKISGTNTLNNYTTNLNQGTIKFALNSATNWDRGEIYLVGSGKLELKNVTIKGVISPWLAPNANGRVLFEDVVIDKDGSTGDVQTNVHGVKSNVTFRRVKIYADGQSGITLRDNVAGDGSSALFEDVEIYQARDSWNNESENTLTIKGLIPNRGSVVDISQWLNRLTKVINCKEGTSFLWGGHLEDSTNNIGKVEVYCECAFNSVDENNNAIKCSVFMKDNVVASSTQVLSDNKSASTIRKYYINSDANGRINPFSVLIGEGIRTTGGLQVAGGNNNRIRPRGINTTASFDSKDDIFEFVFVNYNFDTVVYKFGLKNYIDNKIVMMRDNNVTDSEQNVSAYQQINNANQLYDYCKYLKTLESNIEYPTISDLFITT